MSKEIDNLQIERVCFTLPKVVLDAVKDEAETQTKKRLTPVSHSQVVVEALKEYLQLN